jgi:tRNAThr (cytosine32-N3)-methyltransferase
MVRYGCPMDELAFIRALAAIDAVNAEDPQRHASGRPLATVESAHRLQWLARLHPGAPPEARLACAAMHLRRWEHLRSGYPAGRTGYLRWRTTLYGVHADLARGLVAAAGCSEAEAARVAQLVGKRAPTGDTDAQAIEDALCLVFIETQLEAFVPRFDPGKAAAIIAKTWRKMSPAARGHALGLRRQDGDALLAHVQRELASVPAHD